MIMVILMRELFEKLNISPNDEKYYITAFQHSSYVNENHLKSDYERLEFLGDAVLELVMSDYLFRNLEVKEGDMTKLRASYVCENALYEYSLDLELSKYIKVGHGEEMGGGRFKKVILGIIVPYVENPKIVFFSDYKSALQEAVQTEKRSLVYEVVNEEGPAHNKSFSVVVKIDDIIYGSGTAQSKKEAEQEAAKDALAKLAS